MSIVLGKVENNLFGGATSQPHPDLASKTKGKCDFLVFGLVDYALAVRCGRLLSLPIKRRRPQGGRKIEKPLCLYCRLVIVGIFAAPDMVVPNGGILKIIDYRVV